VQSSRVGDNREATRTIAGEYLPVQAARLFRNSFPRYSLQPAPHVGLATDPTDAGGWIEAAAEIPLTPDMLMSHIKGPSMKTGDPDRSVCVFRGKMAR
jgi:hypothetical protein